MEALLPPVFGHKVACLNTCNSAAIWMTGTQWRSEGGGSCPRAPVRGCILIIIILKYQPKRSKIHLFSKEHFPKLPTKGGV